MIAGLSRLDCPGVLTGVFYHKIADAVQARYCRRVDTHECVYVCDENTHTDVDANTDANTPLYSVSVFATASECVGVCVCVCLCVKKSECESAAAFACKAQVKI